MQAMRGYETGCNSPLSFSATGPCVSAVGGGGASPMRFSYSQGSVTTGITIGLAVDLAAAFFAAALFFLATAFFGAASSAAAGLLLGQNRYTPDLSVFSNR